MNSKISSSNRKLALIIGNDNYSRPETKLTNCINDVNDITIVLRKMKFNVTTKRNLTKVQIISTIENFSKKILDGDFIFLVMVMK